MQSLRLASFCTAGFCNQLLQWRVYCRGPSSTIIYASIANPGSPKSGKKVVFSQIQSKTLEDSFRFKQYLSPPSRKWLANLLGLSKRQVVTWFQNRRARERKRAGIRLPRHGKKCVVNFTTHTISAKEYGVSEDDEEFIDIVVQRAK